MRDTVRLLRVNLATSDPTALSQFDHAAFESTMRAVVGRAFPSSAADSVTLIRTIRLDLGTYRSADPGTLAAEVGRRIGGRLAHGVTDDGTGNVICFPSVAEYLAHFVEQYLSGRSLDVWYFKPLKNHLAPSREATLRNLARAEPDAWRKVVRLLYERGFLLHSSISPNRLMALASPDQSRDDLTEQFGWPLFLVAWRIVGAITEPESDPPVGGTMPPRVTSNSGRGSAQAAYVRYLSTSPPHLNAWDPESLGRHIARIVDFLLDDEPLINADYQRAESTVLELGGIAPQRILAVLRRRSSGATPVHGRDEVQTGSRSLPSSATAGLNRTSALRLLAAATRAWRAFGLTPRNPSAPVPYTSDEALDQALVVDAAARTLRNSSTPYSVESVLARLESEGQALDAPNVGASATGALRHLARAASHLTREERCELAHALVEHADRIPAPGVQTELVGLLFLIRPLLDVQLYELAVRRDLDVHAIRSVLRALAEHVVGETSDPAIDVFATGCLEPVRTQPVLSSQRMASVMSAVAERMGALGVTELPRASSDAAWTVDDMGAALAPMCCRLFTKWLRGFQKSSVAFTVREFIRSRGTLRFLDDEILVVTPPLATDIVLDLAHYRDPIADVPWWTGTGLSWTR